MIFKDYYKILGLKNNNVTAEEIKQAYREQAKKYHPDINTTSDFAEERFKDINEAYKTLSNSSTRRKYDRMWNSRIGKKQKNKQQNKKEKKSIFVEMFQMFFGEIKQKEKKKEEKQKSPKKGENIETEITVSIFEAFYGMEKKIALRTIDGKMREFNVKIPAGIRNEEKIRLMGQGKPGENGGKSGDLLIKIHIENDKKFKLNGIDIYTDLYITPWEAALGTKLNINSIDEEILLYIPQGTESGENICLKGKGYLNGRGGRGDLFVNVQIMIPKSITEKEKTIFEQLREISKYNPREIQR
ncbi:dnaJ-class molecular chaperone with C-terminal Zn finger domain [Clostridium sp. CAG:567]|jgi:curved DNA-binding protein|nr:dnaJ-class molecular chaperone with C-terminal Zn finger domain [Clostridium sp. CAG:567]